MSRHADNTDAECDGCCCSDFINLPEPQEDSDWSFNLTNPIHRLFAQAKFHYFNGKTIEPISSATYDKVVPALRLATRMLRDDRAVRYVCTMHDGTLHDESHAESPALSWAEIDAAEPPFDEADTSYLPQAKLTRQPLEMVSSAEDMRKRSAEILEKVASILTCIFFWEGDLQKPHGVTGLLLSTSHFGRLDENARRDFPRSMAARISISGSFAQIDKDEPTPTSQYQLARVLVHEVGHVLNKTFHGYREYEVFYQDSSTSEAGFELENAIFGGTCEDYDLQQCTGLFANPTPVLLVEHWPSIRIYLLYKDRGYNFARRGELESFVTVSRLTPDFLAKLCDDAYWNEREQRALSSSTLSDELIAPRDPYSWVVAVDENNVVDFFAYEKHYETLPPSVSQQCLDIYRKKLDRFRSAQRSVVRTEVDNGQSERSPEMPNVRSLPGQAGEWCGKPSYGCL